MEHGILKVSETRKREIKANEATITLVVTSDKIVFGNAAVTAAQHLEPVIKFISSADPVVQIDTQSVQIVSSAGLFGKGSRAVYTLKITTKRLDKLGDMLGRCSEAKDMTVRGITWGYDDETARQELVLEAARKAKTKAEQMMAAIGYRVVGIRSCSDDYSTPNIGEIIMPGSDSDEMEAVGRVKRYAVARSVSMGTEFASSKEVSATCTIEFVIQPEPRPA